MKKNANVFKQLLTATVFLALFGCKKSIIEYQADPLLSTGKQGSALATLDVTPDVYVAGTIGLNQAVYWKNGQAVVLPAGAVATGIVVVGTDVYVCGYGINASTGNEVAQYWKNGVLTNLSDGTENVAAAGISVLGTDVYISGNSGRYVETALYWKNGVLTTLGGGLAGPVTVAANGDVYVPDRESTSYWKNGTLVTLPGGNSLSGVRAIAVQGSTVYAVGYNAAGGQESPLYWINGVQQFLMHPQPFTGANDIEVSATGQAFISGTASQDGSTSTMQVAYWNPLGDIETHGTAYIGYPRITVDGTDVYISGGESVNQERAAYWMNGNVVYLTDGSSASYALDITLGQ